MPDPPDAAGFLPRERFSDLLSSLRTHGFQTVGPRVRDDTIVYGALSDAGDLPIGTGLRHGPGRCTLESTDSNRMFAWSNGPQAVKPFAFAPRENLWQAAPGDNGALQFKPVEPDPDPVAIIGVRACDLAALELQDRHFMDGDPHYRSRRETILLIAVNCTHPSDTCFCASTGDGPTAKDGFDICLDELDDGFLVRAGTFAGERILETISLEPALPGQQEKAERACQAAAQAQQRSIPTGNLFPQLLERQEHPRWEDVSGRCLSCGNCTSVCPTCFCYHAFDEAELDGVRATHVREWDSCFTQGHSYIHGLTIRADTRTRYRQWLTHKLGSWHEQYGRSGCVGCGRCITWCPVGIDITEEVNALLADGGER